MAAERSLPGCLSCDFFGDHKQQDVSFSKFHCVRVTHRISQALPASYTLQTTTVTCRHEELDEYRLTVTCAVHSEHAALTAGFARLPLKTYKVSLLQAVMLRASNNLYPALQEMNDEQRMYQYML